MTQQLASKQQQARASEIARIITSQMGGSGRLSAMIGAFNFYAISESETSEGGLQFRFKQCRKANYVEVHLAPDDTYTVKFFKIQKFSLTPVQEFTGIYCDQLISTFERFTDVFLSF